MILLDTNVLSALMRDPPDAAVVDWLDTQAPEQVWTTAVNAFEVRFGLARMTEWLSPTRSGQGSGRARGRLGRRHPPRCSSARRRGSRRCWDQSRGATCAMSGCRACRVSPPATRPRRRPSGRSRRSPRAPVRSSVPGPAMRRAPARGCVGRTWYGRARQHRSQAGRQANAVGLRSAAMDGQRPSAAGDRSRSPRRNSRVDGRARRCGADARPRAPQASPTPSGSHAAAAPCHTPASCRPGSAPGGSCGGTARWPCRASGIQRTRERPYTLCSPVAKARSVRIVHQRLVLPENGRTSGSTQHDWNSSSLGPQQ